MPSIDIIAVPYDSGLRAERMGRGPLHLLERGVPERLAEDGHDVRVDLDVHDPDEAQADGYRAPNELARAIGRLASPVRRSSPLFSSSTPPTS